MKMMMLLAHRQNDCNEDHPKYLAIESRPFDIYVDQCKKEKMKMATPEHNPNNEMPW
jgi:hypothetical protein